MNDLILIKPSKDLEREILEYKQEYFDFGETRINGSCGLAYYDNFDEWLNLVLSIEKDNLMAFTQVPFFLCVKKTIKLLVVLNFTIF